MPEEIEKTEQQKFLDEIAENQKEKADILSDPIEVPVPEKAEAKPDEESAEMKLKNRRERRLAEKWQAEREANIALNARLEAISESQSLRGSEEADYLKRVERIYGTATPEGKEATELLKSALTDLKESATREALKAWEAKAAEEARAQKKEEATLEEISDRVEEAYGIDMSNEAERKGYFTLLEKLSPKDADGNVSEYADPEATAELYISRKEKASSRAKELAARSMVRSGSAPQSKLEDDATLRYLKENGIL